MISQNTEKKKEKQKSISIVGSRFFCGFFGVVVV